MINIICIFLITITAISSIFYTLRHLCRTCTFLAFHCFHSIHAINFCLYYLSLSSSFYFLYLDLWIVVVVVVSMYVYILFVDCMMYCCDDINLNRWSVVYILVIFFYFDTSIWLKFTKFSWFYVYMKFLAMILALSTIRLDTGPHLLLH